MTEKDLEGKDPMVYGDLFSSGDPVEKSDVPNLSDVVSEIDFEPLLPAQPPIETIEE